MGTHRMGRSSTTSTRILPCRLSNQQRNQQRKNTTMTTTTKIENTCTVVFEHPDEKRQSIKYTETDGNGHETEYHYQNVGPHYIKKRMFGNRIPKKVTCVYTWEF